MRLPAIIPCDWFFTNAVGAAVKLLEPKAHHVSLPGGTIKFDATGKPQTQYVMVQNLPQRKVAIVWPKEMPGYTDAVLPIPGK